MVDWSTLSKDLLGLIAVRLFCVVDLFHFRSVCRSWRSCVSGIPEDNNLPNRHLDSINPLIVTVKGNESIPDRCKSVSRAVFFRVTLSSSSSTQGWLIKSDEEVDYGTFRLLNPLSRLPLRHWYKSIDLLKFRIYGIQEAYEIQDKRTKKTALGFKRLVLVKVEGGDHRVLGVGCDGRIRYWNGEIWTRIRDQIAEFSDIIVHNGITYALDLKGVVWRISSSLSIFRYGPSLEESMTNYCCKDLSFVECCGEFYIVDRLFKDTLRKRKAFCVNARLHDDTGNTKCELSETCQKTVGFKVYRMDKELGKWIEAKSLGDNVFFMATDTCFSVLAHDYYGCLQNSLYFVDEEEEDAIKVFKLDDGSITKMVGFSQGCFQMFVPSFV